MSAEPATSGPGRSVRTRVFVVALVLSALTILSATIADALIARARLQDSVSGALDRAWEEFDQLATTGVDPETGEPFTTAASVIALSMQRTVPEPAQGMLGIVGGELALLAPDGVTLRLEDDPELVAEMLLQSQGTDVMRGTLSTTSARYEYIVVPVASVSDGTNGAIVYAFEMTRLESELAAEYLTNGFVGLIALAITGIVMWVIVGRLLEPLGWLRDAAGSIDDSDLHTRIPVRGRDDIADLTVSFNGMLDRLQSAFASQRELLDDVGHELKTPLTVVRGHLELLDTADPSEVEQVRSVALDEIDRMDRLVEDIITLAKSDRPDFVRPEPANAAVLIDEVFDKARQLGDRVWRLGPLADVDVALDRQRVTQALLQLATNAVKYSDPDATIELGSELRGGTIRLWVRDTGHGIPADEHAAIFDRFSRGSGAHESADGRGLGLSIVRSIARAHGGDIDLVSSPGAGSTFTLVLPTRVPPRSDTQPGPSTAAPEDS